MTIKHNKQRDREQRKKDESLAKLNDLPNTMKFAAEALKIMSERGGSAGSIVVNKYKSWNYKHIYALVMNTLKNIKIIKKIIYDVKLAKKVPVDDPFLLEILVGELLFGRGLKSVEQNPKAAAVIGQKDAILKQQAALKDQFTTNNEQDSGAKYLRLNHLKSNMEHVLAQLKSAGLNQVPYTKENTKFKKFINKFKAMKDNEFMLDFHFPNDLVVMKPEAANKLKSTQLVTKKKVMLQDKASFMAVEAMDIKPGQNIIDACCAPGGKTVLIASKMKNKGKILAYDVDKKRLLSAISMLKLHGATCAKTEVQDFTQVKLKRLPKVHNINSFDSIIIDPSCSGSGITSRVDYKESTVIAGRLKKLQAFQVSMLKHALKAKISKSIVYCTCSNSIEENEQVIEMALNESGVKSSWNVVNVLPYWPHRGEGNYEFGEKCVRSDKNELTNGFFIAKLERTNPDDPMDSSEAHSTVDNISKDCDMKDECMSEDGNVHDRRKPPKGNKIGVKGENDDEDKDEDDAEDEDDDDDDDDDEDQDEDDEEGDEEEEDDDDEEDEDEESDSDL